MRICLLLVVLVISHGTALLAETTRETAARLCVDVVVVNGGREARGSIVQRGADGAVTIAVRRGWLKSRQPEWLAELDKATAEGRQAARETLITRTREWLTERADEKKLVAVVRMELERLEKETAKPPVVAEEPADSEFLLIELTAEQVRRVFAQPPDRQQAALVAWDQQIDNVEATAINKLHETLEKRKVDWRTMRVDLSARLTSSKADGEREWAARQAVFEFSLGKRVEFQGTGDFVVRTGTDAAGPAGIELLAGVLQGGLDADVTELLQGIPTPQTKPADKSAWLESASRTAEKEGVRGFRVTRSQQNVLQQMVTVEDRFVARMPDGKWETIYIASETLDGSVERKDLETRIREDGQVSETLKLVEGLGLGGQIDTAVRFGAATMEAQQTTSRQFFEFTDRYSQKLDRPVLKWDAAAE
jgi:hypothetical protein